MFKFVPVVLTLIVFAGKVYASDALKCGIYDVAEEFINIKKLPIDKHAQIEISELGSEVSVTYHTKYPT